MRFEFSEDQQLLRSTVRDFLEGECGSDSVRALWETGTGRSPELWKKLAEVGLPGLLVPEAHEGMGMDEVDAVLLWEEVGRAGLAEPVTATAAVAPPLLGELGAELASRWLKPIAVGEAIVAVGHPVCPFVDDAHVADLLLLVHADEIHALAPGDVTLTSQKTNDPARRIQSVAWTPRAETRVAQAESGRALQAAALDRGALASAAQQLGACDRMLELAVVYTSERRQFGVPVGSFQAVKHMLADVKVKLEYARPLVYRAADSLARGLTRRAVHVSMAAVAASEAANLAAKTALQAHGAIGYTWEQDLHIWMRRAWSLDQAWGLPRFHRRRVADFALAADAPLGAGRTFEE
jgi:alkylation response protein AidB-like acyl-CoA dehydrogenase